MGIGRWVTKFFDLFDPGPEWHNQTNTSNAPIIRRQTSRETKDMNNNFNQNPNAMQPMSQGNYSAGQRQQFSKERHMEVSLAGNPYRFFMTHEAQSKFNEYARAALFVTGQYKVSEIGGLARVQRYGNDWVCMDIKIFEQEATAGYFELDDMAVARFMMQLHKDGKDAEIPEWCSLIHSHPPGCEPFLSNTDEENITRLGHGRFAWSIIATAHQDTSKMYGNAYAVHFFSDGEIPVLMKKMPVMTIHPDRSTIEAEVKTLIKKQEPVIGKGWGKSQQGNMHIPGAAPAPMTVKTQDPPEFNFDLVATGIGIGDTVVIKLQEDSLVGANAEEVKVLKSMNGEEFDVVGIDPNGFIINSVIFLPTEVELITKLTAEATESVSEALDQSVEASPLDTKAASQEAVQTPTATSDGDPED